MIEEIVEAESEEIINILKTNLIDNESSKYLKKKLFVIIDCLKLKSLVKYKGKIESYYLVIWIQ
jgi:hypothetical protein